jgi:hypothetical protein
MTTSKGRIFVTTLVGYLCLTAANSLAQMNVLTIREAEQILDLVPAVADSIAQGRCPSYDVFDESPIWLSIQVRETCPRPGFVSNLLGSYVINRRTGAVASGLDADDRTGPWISTPKLTTLTNDLLRRARARVLNAKEAECLALEAARSEMGASEPTGTYSASKLAEGRGEFRFRVEQHLANKPAVAVKLFTIRSDAVSVRDDDIGEAVISPGLALLSSTILSAQDSSHLSVDDALTIALQVPSLGRSVANGCSELVSDGNGASIEMYIVLRTQCPGTDTIRTVAAVNAQSGRVTDPKTHKSLDSPESEKIAREILKRRQEKLDQDKSAVAAACKLSEK